MGKFRKDEVTEVITNDRQMKRQPIAKLKLA